jgi:hypothetical protein
LPTGKRFGSTILVPEIYCLETTLESLQPPQWPEEWGAGDKDGFDRGRVLFEQEKCASCHRPERYEKGQQPSPGKDVEWKIQNPDVHTDLSALTAQTSMRYDLSAVKPGDVSVSAIEGLNTIIPKVVAFQYDRLRLSPEERRRFDGFGREPKGQSPPGWYHARPLHGIWATPPFLHNGSVRSLYELLLPADRRAKRFWIGPNQQYDIHKLGFTADRGPGSVEFDTTLPANGNMGHEYGTKLSDEDRYRLLEYLKFLGRGHEFDRNADDPDARPPEPKDLKDRLKDACEGRRLQGPAGEPAP